jgi:DNA-directed RNA polymerase specialized sigma24 family protein
VARALFAHDWRRAPLGPFLDRQSAWAMAGADPRDHGEPADYPVLSRPEFDSAIRAALKSLRSDDLERNVLARSRLAGPAADGSRADALREVLTAAIRALSADPKEAKLHRVLDETFLRGTPTQEAAAAMLHLPFSTYRRYLARGTEIISDRLWDAELGAVANGVSPPGGE